MRVEAISPALPELLAWAEMDPEDRMSPIAQQAFRAGWEAAGRSAEPAPVVEQPMPTGEGDAVYLVAQDAFNDMLDGRTRIGAQRYGRALHTHNGRNAFQDAMEELVDCWQYVIQAHMEHDDLIAENAALKAENAALREANDD